MSPDSTFIQGSRQGVISSKKLEKWLTQDTKDFCVNETMLRNYMRNRALIDLSCIPDEIVVGIRNLYEKAVPQPRSKILSYFMQHKLKALTESLADF